jgi:Gpi18-like mannosyltransferase
MEYIKTLMFIAKVEIVIRKVLWKSDFLFPVAIWLASRVLIWTGMLLIAPKLLGSEGIVPSFGWGVFDAWDSVHYRAIATTGYEFLDDGNQHNLAFFPLFPLVIRFLISIGLPFEVAGVLVNNLAFLGTLYFLYLWVRGHYGIKEAQWVTAVLALCPLSMFTGVIYTEGMYLLFSTAALQAFDQKKYGWTALCGALATATRPTGMALIPAFAIAAWKQHRHPGAYVAAFSSGIGLLLFSLYCAIHFGHPLAFIQAQRGWRPSLGFDWQGWLNMLIQIAVGTTNWQYGWIKDPLHPLLFSIIVGSGYRLWRLNKHLNSAKVIYGFYALVSLLLIVASDQLINNLLNALMVLGGSYILWRLRTQLTPVTFIYGFCGIGLLLASGGTMSLSRLAYGIVSLSVALGVLLSRHPRRGYMTLGLFAILLVRLAVRFAQELWVG